MMGTARRKSAPLPTLLHRNLSGPLAQIRNDALLAQRAPREAHIAPVQDEPVVSMSLVFVGHDREELLLDFEGSLTGCKTGAVADAKDVRIDRDGRLAECDIENHV